MIPEPGTWELVAAAGRPGRNSGLVRLGWDRRSPPAGPRTAVVLGAFRGGTSMAAAVLARLGVPMGPGRDDVVFEDPDFNTLLARRWVSRGRVRRLVAERDRAHEVWGWKYPGTVRHLGRVSRELRAPHLVVVLRDPLAIAAREHLATGAPLAVALAGATQQLRALVRTVTATPHPALVVSHDKALRTPAAFVDEVIALMGLAPGPEVRAAAVAVVSPEPRAYLDHARTHSYQGHLDGMDGGVAWGWARDAGRVERVTVEVRLDGRSVAKVRAELPRPDLVVAGIGDGRYGFNLILPDGVLDGGRHELRVLMVEADWELPGSPLLIHDVSPRAPGEAP